MDDNTKNKNRPRKTALSQQNLTTYGSNMSWLTRAIISIIIGIMFIVSGVELGKQTTSVRLLILIFFSFKRRKLFIFLYYVYGLDYLTFTSMCNIIICPNLSSLIYTYLFLLLLAGIYLLKCQLNRL